jgi:hypothetical protein
MTVIWIVSPGVFLLLMLAEALFGSSPKYKQYEGGRAAAEAERQRLVGLWCALSEQEKLGDEGRRIMRMFDPLPNWGELIDD